ncbi:MAG TPA: hypothetical protein PLT28_12090, partial [Saprospiraceae bacterium]|nr:hypothetical protein [Saprospiraceae bacterium]
IETYGINDERIIKHLKKEDGSTAEVEESLTVKVIEFNRDDKRILVSHSRYLEDIKKEADNLIKRDKESADNETKSAIKTQQAKLEKTTLGDIDAFSQLKQQFDEAGEKKAEEAKEELALKAKKSTKATKAKEVVAEETAATEGGDTPEDSEKGEDA